MSEIHSADPEIFGHSFHFATQLRNPGALDAALALPLQRWYQTDQQRTAALFRSIIVNHPFIDGNKRVAVIAAAAYAEYCLGRLEASYDDLLAFALTVASGRPGVTDLDSVTRWFEEHWATCPSEHEIDLS